MSDNTRIEWTDATWNPITGCSVLSPGCTNCYAMNLAGTRLRHHPSRSGLTTISKAGPVWTGEVRLNDEWLTQPLTWRRPRNIFVCAHGDLFHNDVPDEWIDRVFAVMALAEQHTFQVLTKRSGRMARYLAGQRADGMPTDLAVLLQTYGLGVNPQGPATRWGAVSRDTYDHWHVSWPLPNVLLGASVEDQDRADQHRDNLGPLARRDGWRTFVSYEPALGPVDWIGWEFLSWMISGGESGAGARPSHPDWHRNARDFCAREGIPFFFKQWGEWAPHTAHIADENGDIRTFRVGKKRAGRLLDGVEHNEMPTP